MLAINYLCLHKDSQPEFEALKEKGWTHPMGLQGEPLKSSLMKVFEDTEFQVVQHRFKGRAEDHTYTEIFLHPKRGGSQILKKGYGKAFGIQEACRALKWLDKELR